MSQFTDYLVEQLDGFGPVQCRRMFGGYGLFRDSLMFALVAGDTLYLKTDAGNEADFLARGLEPFIYYRREEPVALSYYLAPEEALEDPRLLAEWATAAFAAARRSAAKRPRRRARAARGIARPSPT